MGQKTHRGFSIRYSRLNARRSILKEHNEAVVRVPVVPVLIVIELQNAIEQFPTNLIGNMFGFKTREFFQLGSDEQAAKEPVKVSF